MNMKIGLVQYRYINNDIAFNLSQIEKAMISSRNKADLLCFGETFLQGFDALNWSFENDRNIAVTQDSEIIQHLCEMTVHYGIDLLFGYIERDGESLYSSCMVIEKGRILHNYRRVSIGWKEHSITDDHYREGTEITPFVYHDRKILLALCGDLWEYPERFHTDALMIWPVYVDFTIEEWHEEFEQEYPKQALLAAEETLMINSVTDSPKAVGGTFHMKNGRIIAKLPYDTEDILYVTIRAPSHS